MASVYSFQFLSSPFYSSMPLTHHSKSLHFKTVQCSQQNELDKTLSFWVEGSEQSDTRRRETLFGLILAAFSSSFISSAALAIGEDQREFDYVKGSGKGPENWGDIHHEWASCKNGSLQSPIDLLHERVEVVPDLGKVKRSYRTSNAILKNRGHDLELLWKIGTAGSIQINGTDYALEQCHWHSPSEHTINGHEFSLELHMVHRNLELNKAAVIGVLFNIGRPDKFLTEIEKEIKAIADSNNELNVGMINPKHIMLGGPMYYRYLGSLTTPPCTEGVIWTINKRLRTVSAEQIKLLRTAVHDDSERNARPLQLLNDRDILFYDPKNRPLDLNN